MTAPLTQAIDITRGDDYAATVTFDQPVAAFSEIRFTVRESWATTETDNTDATLTTTLTPSATSAADLDLTSTQTLALVLDQYVYDIQVITASGSKVFTTQRGTLRVSPDVTR